MQENMHPFFLKKSGNSFTMEPYCNAKTAYCDLDIMVLSGGLQHWAFTWLYVKLWFPPFWFSAEDQEESSDGAGTEEELLTE